MNFSKSIPSPIALDPLTATIRDEFVKKIQAHFLMDATMNL